MLKIQLISKILIINSSSPYDLVGGTQTSLDYVISNLRNKNFQVSFISWSFMNKKDGFYISKKYNGLRLPDFRKRFIYTIFFLIKNFSRIKKIFDVDVVWVHSPLPWFFLTYLFNKNSKLIYTVHGPLKKEIQYSKSKFKYLKLLISNFVLKIATHKANLIHYNSNYVYNASVSESSFLSRKKKIILELLLDDYLFYNKVLNTSKLKLINKYHFLNKRFFLISRRLIKRTGVFEFIKLINKDEYFNKYIFVVTGDGPKKIDILNIIKNNVIFLGEIDETNINFLKSNAFCFVIPSIEAEGYSLLAKEARVLNKFVIHTNQGGLKESLLNYQKSKIFNINNIESLKRIFNEISSEYSLNTNQLKINKFDESNFYNKLIKLFKSI